MFGCVAVLCCNRKFINNFLIPLFNSYGNWKIVCYPDFHSGHSSTTHHKSCISISITRWISESRFESWRFEFLWAIKIRVGCETNIGEEIMSYIQFARSSSHPQIWRDVSSVNSISATVSCRICFPTRQTQIEKLDYFCSPVGSGAAKSITVCGREKKHWRINDPLIHIPQQTHLSNCIADCSKPLRRENFTAITFRSASFFFRNVFMLPVSFCFLWREVSVLPFPPIKATNKVNVEMKAATA